MRFLFLTTLMFLLASPTQAGTYKWIDENGAVHFGDKPPQQVNAEEVTLHVNTYTNKIDIEALLAPDKEPVVIYSTKRCQYCKKAKKLFRANNIPFQEYDIEMSTKGRQDYRLLNGRGVPIILVGEQRMNGFNEERLTRLLEDAGYRL